MEAKFEGSKANAVRLKQVLEAEMKCSFMDKYTNNGGGGAFDVTGIYSSSFEGSQMLGSGIRMFEDIWKGK
ncbi:hypothetical protein GIB67_040229, partial [Kingdonia uniflora]